jgi:threonine/homoserine/homoserine lactone efflux protein
MDLNFFLKGILLGFSIAAPVGPIGMLCIQRTVQFGRFSGFFTGLGAALADTLYGIIAAFGLTLVSNFLIAGQLWLRLFGGIFLLYLGLKTVFTKPKEKASSISHKTLLNDLFSTFFLTLSNPMTIFAYFAVFAGLGLVDTKENYSEATWLVSGVFLGSSLWWLLLSEGLSLFRHKISPKAMVWINRIAGLFISGFGLFLLGSLTLRWFH